MHQSKLDARFKDEVLAEPGGEHLVRCYSCGTCMSTCLVSRVSPEFNPRRTLHMVMVGMREAALSGPTAWLCSACDACYPRCPQNIHISELMQAIKNVAIRDGFEPPGPVAEVDEAACSGCGICVKACPYGALSRVTKEVEGKERPVAQVDRFRCMNCGICSAACPLAAITVEEYSNEQIAARTQAGGWFSSKKLVPPGEPRILVFNCNWNMRNEVDVAALSRFSPNVRIITMPCSGRVDPVFILLALQQGADGVLVAGCKGGDCHYKQGTYITQGRMQVLHNMFGQMSLNGGRVRFEQIDPDQRGRLPELIDGFVAERKAAAAAAS